MRNITFDKVFTAKWMHRVFALSLVVSYLLAVYGIFRTNLIPGKYLLPALLIPGLVSAVLIYFQLFKSFSRIKGIILAVLSVLVIAGNLYLFSLGAATTKFFDSIQSDGYTYEEYSVVALKDVHVKLSSGEHTTGIITTDTNNDQVKAEMEERTKTTYAPVDDLTSLGLSLANRQTDTSVLKSAYLQLVSENNPAMYQNIEVLATFTVKVKNAIVPTVKDTSKPFVLYVSGIDTYGAIGTVARSDVNILLVMNPETHRILLVNTPRDYYVQLHGTTGLRDKLTHAGIYGIDTSVQTLQDLYGIPIDYYLRVNFATLTNVVDTLGGVSVYSDNDFTAEGTHFSVGYNQLDGKEALTFSRARHQFAEGDRTRGQNQQRVIEAIITKLSTPETLVNYRNIMAALAGTFQTNAGSGTITSIMNKQLDDLSKWMVESTSVDGTGTTAPTYSMGATPLYVMEPDQKTVDAAKQKIHSYLSE
ncbi:MAG TPA: LCP family protein [Candidatus Saccharimonadales bacterium]|nr:LCP family protein [Candidatus Saccharimonadales bacterium]